MVILELVGLVASLALILLSCELFTNGIEWLGKKLNLGEGVVGCIFSAVGTCLPETILPVIAILFMKDSVDIGIGAIAGAPFMLSTLAFFLTGLSALLFWKRRGGGVVMHVKEKILSRDIGFFIVVYSIGIASSFISSGIIKTIVALFLVGYYIFYIYLTVKGDNQCACEGDIEDLYLTRLTRVKTNMPLIIFQIAIALAGIIFGAEIFIHNIENISEAIKLPTLVLSLIIAPIATELPEKFNSIIWVSKKKDTLALGNITGAMVFQSCIPVAIGIMFTPWQLDMKVLVSAVIAIASASVAYISIKVKKRLTCIPLLTGGLFYATFIIFLVIRGLN